MKRRSNAARSISTNPQPTHLRQVTTPARELLQPEEELRNTDGAAWELFFDSSPLASWFIDPVTMRIVSMNCAAVVSYGYTRKEFLQMTVGDLQPNGNFEALLGRVPEMEGRLERFAKKTGIPVYARISARSVAVGQRTLTLLIAEDINPPVFMG